MSAMQVEMERSKKRTFAKEKKKQTSSHRTGDKMYDLNMSK